MGIFSSEYEYYAFSQTQPLIGDEDKQDTLLTFVVSALKHDEENLVGNIIAATRAGLPGTAYQYFKYGQNSYYWGLPESNYTSFNLDTKSILDVIGHDKFIKETYLPVDGAFMAALQYLNAQSWYDINKKQISLPDTITVQGALADPFSFGVSISSNFANRIQITFPVTYSPPDPGKPEYYYIEVYDPANVGRLGDALWVIYGLKSQQHEPEPPGWDQNLVWPPNYQFSAYYPSSAFPTAPLDLEPTQFYPIAVFQRDYASYHSNGVWKTTLQELVNKLNIDADEVYEEFLKSIRNSQAKEAELVDFCIGFLVQIYGDLTPDAWKNPHQKYVFEFISELHKGSHLTRSHYETYLQELDDWNNWEDPDAPLNPEPGDSYIPRKPRKPRPPQQSMYVSEADKQGFNYIYSYSLIEKYTSTTSHADAESKFIPFSLDTQNGHYGQWIRGIIFEESGSQIYVSYMLVNGEAQYIVNTPDGYRAARPESGVWCPISYELLKRLPFRDQEAVLQDGLCAVVYTVLEQEIKWYTGTFWSGITIIITFVLTAWLGGVGVSGVLQAIGLGAVTGVALFIATLVIKFTVGFLIQMTGAILGLPPAAQALFSFMMGGISSGGVSFAGFSSFFSDLWLTVGDFTFDAVVALASKVSQLYQVGRMILSEINGGDDLETGEDYTQSEQDRREEVEQAYIGNSSRRITDPHLELSRRLDTNMFETPTEYMARTTMINPGAQALTVPANYVDMALQLPRTMSTGVTVGVFV